MQCNANGTHDTTHSLSVPWACDSPPAAGNDHWIRGFYLITEVKEEADIEIAFDESEAYLFEDLRDQLIRNMLAKMKLSVPAPDGDGRWVILSRVAIN